MRIGMGYDVHRLVEGRRLVLGGVEIPHSMGLLGHSDADVLVHAICDAILGAAGLGDIGLHFPDSDPAYKDICSLDLLRQTCDMISQKGLAVANLDATVVAEAPRIAPFRAAMQNRLSAVVGIEPGRINIKATTTEGLGGIGKGEGMAAMCVALLERALPPVPMDDT